MKNNINNIEDLISAVGEKTLRVDKVNGKYLDNGDLGKYITAMRYDKDPEIKNELATYCNRVNEEIIGTQKQSYDVYGTQEEEEKIYKMLGINCKTDQNPQIVDVISVVGRDLPMSICEIIYQASKPGNDFEKGVEKAYEIAKKGLEIEYELLKKSQEWTQKRYQNFPEIRTNPLKPFKQKA